MKEAGPDVVSWRCPVASCSSWSINRDFAAAVNRITTKNDEIHHRLQTGAGDDRCRSSVRPSPRETLQTTAQLTNASAYRLIGRYRRSKHSISVSLTSFSMICRMTNYELLRWFVEMPSRDVYRYRMINASRSTVYHYNDTRSRDRVSF